MGIYCHWPNVFESTLLHIFADLVRKAIADWDPTDIMSLIKDRLFPGKTPNIVTECAKFFPNFLKTLRIVYHSTDLPGRTDHSFRFHDAIDILLGKCSDPVIIKTCEA